MEEISHSIFVGGPQAPVGFHVRPCYDVSRFSGDVQKEHPEVRAFLFVPDDQDADIVPPDRYLDSGASMLYLMGTVLPAFSMSVRQRLCYVLQGPANIIQEIAADVESDFREMAGNWKNCMYKYDDDVI